MTIDLPDVAAAALRSAGYADARTARIADIANTGGIAVRRIPATVTGRYYDGSLDVSYLFQVVVARESERDAMDECCEIADLLPKLALASGNGSYRLTSVETYTEPQEVELTGSGTHVWEARFKAVLTTERN